MTDDATGAADHADHRESGQPRPQAEGSVRSPSAAERARTLVEGNSSAGLDIPGCEYRDPTGALPAARAVLPDGDVLLLMPGDSPAARFAAHAQDDDLACVLEITDVAPVAVAHRIRGRAWVAGWLTPVRGDDRETGLALLERPVEPDPRWTLLRLEVGEVLVDDLWGAEHVEPEEFARAAPDPLAGYEAELLQHLAAAHGDQMRRLCSLLGEDAPSCSGGRRPLMAAPLSLDRFGLRVRFTGEGPAFDARFDFPEPVTCHEDLRRAMHRLFEAAER
nr:DUF2470 domain-containing protein [Wenjunlia tyrosinilytica]